MGQHQLKIDIICILKLLNIIVGVLNAMVSILGAYLMVLLTLTLTFFLHYKLSWFHVVCLAIFLMILAKFCFDILFIYNVVKENPVTVETYFYFSFVLLTMLSIFVISAGYSDIPVLVFLYGLNISTILLTYFYHTKITTVDNV